MKRLIKLLKVTGLSALSVLALAAGAQEPPGQGDMPPPFSGLAASLAASQLGTIALEANEEGSNMVARMAWERGKWLLFVRLAAEVTKGTEEVTLASVTELQAPTVGTLGFSYLLGKPRSSVEVIEDDCREFRQDVFAELASNRPDFQPIAIEAGECRLEKLQQRSEDLFIDVTMKHNEKLNALCDTYNASRGSGRLLATRLEDGRTPLAFEQGAEELKSTFGQLCTVDNLVAAMRAEAKRKAAPGKGEEAAAKAEKEVRGQLAKAVLPFCQRYNDSGYALLRRLEPQGAIPAGGTRDRGCSQEEIRTVLADADLAAELGKERFKALEKRWLKRLEQNSPFSFWSLTGSVTEGKSDFQIFDPAGYDPTTDDPIGDATTAVTKTSRNLSLGVTRFTQRWSIGASYSRKRDVKAPPQTEVCLPITDTELSSCLTARITDPGEKDTDLMTLEYKRFIRRSLGARFSVAYDFDKKEAEPHVTLYFLNQKGKGLAGGLDVFYSNELDRPAGRVFIGAAFSVFPD